MRQHSKALNSQMLLSTIEGIELTMAAKSQKVGRLLSLTQVMGELDSLLEHDHSDEERHRFNLRQQRLILNVI